MNTVVIPTQTLYVYMLLHLRFVGMMFSAPIFSSSMAPAPFRYLFAVTLTAASIPAVGENVIATVLFDSAFTVGLLCMRELLIGIALGLFSSLPLMALRITGEQIGTLIGFSMAQVMDPATQTENSILGQLNFLVGMWFYFRWNGHLIMVQAVMETLKLIPIGGISPLPMGDMAIGLWLQELFILSMRIVIPFYCALILSDIGLGFLARTVPQMNIFVLGLPVKVALGFMVLTVILPLTVDLIFNHFERWVEFALGGVQVWRAVSQ